MLDNVHCSNCKAGTVDEASDVATYVDIVQVERMCDALLVVLLRSIFFTFKFILPKHRVIIDDDLRISCKYRALAGQSHRVDLNQLAVLF